jgi:hypothetical protein
MATLKNPWEEDLSKDAPTPNAKNPWEEDFSAPSEVPQHGVLKTIAEQGLQGATMGFWDEIAGTIEGLTDSGMTVKEAIESTRKRLEEEKQQHEVIAPISEFAGSMANPLTKPIAGLKYVSKMPAISKFLTTAAIEGGIGGAGYGDVLTGGDISEIPKTASLQAGLGGALGGAAKLTGAAGRVLGSALEKPIEQVKRSVSQGLETAKGVRPTIVASDMFKNMAAANDKIRMMMKDSLDMAGKQKETAIRQLQLSMPEIPKQDFMNMVKSTMNNLSTDNSFVQMNNIEKHKVVNELNQTLQNALFGNSAKGESFKKIMNKNMKDKLDMENRITEAFQSGEINARQLNQMLAELERKSSTQIDDLWRMSTEKITPIKLDRYKQELQERLGFGKNEVVLGGQKINIDFGSPKGISSNANIKPLNDLASKVKNYLNDAAENNGINLKTFNEKYHNLSNIRDMDININDFMAAAKGEASIGAQKADLFNKLALEHPELASQAPELIAMAREANTLANVSSKLEGEGFKGSLLRGASTLAREVSPLVPDISPRILAAGKAILPGQRFVNAAVRQFSIPRTQQGIEENKDAIIQEVAAKEGPMAAQSLATAFEHGGEAIKRVAPHIIETFSNLFMPSTFASEFDGKLANPEDKMKYLKDIEKDETMSNIDKAKRAHIMNKDSRMFGNQKVYSVGQPTLLDQILTK